MQKKLEQKSTIYLLESVNCNDTPVNKCHYVSALYGHLGRISDEIF